MGRISASGKGGTGNRARNLVKTEQTSDVLAWEAGASPPVVPMPPLLKACGFPLKNPENLSAHADSKTLEGAPESARETAIYPEAIPLITRLKILSPRRECAPLS